ncbi:hypothetical protein TNCV_2654501 [Trichonephila clavipes]|nr:hypothetical protein TNCV_2654501 [Trichonephila clavipes]
MRDRLRTAFSESFKKMNRSIGKQSTRKGILTGVPANDVMNDHSKIHVSLLSQLRNETKSANHAMFSNLTFSVNVKNVFKSRRSSHRLIFCTTRLSESSCRAKGGGGCKIRREIAFAFCLWTDLPASGRKEEKKVYVPHRSGSCHPH